MKLKILSIISIILFTGCSTRSYFEPKKNIQKEIIVKNNLNSKIINITKDIATLDNGNTIPKTTKLPKGFIALDKDLAIKGYILRVNNKFITFKKLIATAKKDGNLIAIIFGDNSFSLFNLNQNKIIYNYNFGPSLANRKFIAQPVFYKDLILIPSLNGQVGIYDKTKNKILNKITVSKKDYFNNIIYLGVKNDNLIMASRDEIKVISPMIHYSKSYNIRHILVDNNYIYIFTLSGEVKKLNFGLKELKHINFKYAIILSPTIYNGNIYFLSRGDKSYLVKLNKNLEDYKVYPLEYINNQIYSDNQIEPLYLKQNIFANDGKYYIGDIYFKLK